MIIPSETERLKFKGLFIYQRVNFPYDYGAVVSGRKLQMRVISACHSVEIKIPVTRTTPQSNEVNMANSAVKSVWQQIQDTSGCLSANHNKHQSLLRHLYTNKKKSNTIYCTVSLSSGSCVLMTEV